MNNEDPSIKFELEHPENTTLSLLDFSVTLLHNGEAKFCYYKKKARKNTFIHQKSAMPEACKNNSIKNEIKRIKEKCTTKEDQQVNVNTFREQLVARGYQKSSHNAPKRRRNANKPPFPISTATSSSLTSTKLSIRPSSVPSEQLNSQ